MKPNDMNGLWDDSHLTVSIEKVSNTDRCRRCGDWIEIHDGKSVCKSGCPMTPKQAYEFLKDLEAELDNTMLMSPDPHEGPEAIEAHDTEVTRLRKEIAAYRDGIASAYDDPTKPF